MTLTRNNSGKSRALSSLVAGVLLAFASVALASVPDERRVTMTYADGNLSLSAKDVPLQQVMQEVGQLIGARVHWVEQPQQTPLSVEFRNLPLDPALRRILRDRNFLARYRTDAISTKLIEVIILSNIETSTLAEQLPAEGPPSLPETTVPANPAWANGEERDLHAIEESISTEAEPWFVEAAIDATERAHNGQGAAEVLLQLFDEQSDVQLRALALDRLADTLPEAVDLVIDVARNEAEPSLRARAVALLTAHANHPEVEGILETVAASDPQPAVREVAAAALGELR